MKRRISDGVKVLGSAVLRVDPDVAMLQFSVGRQAKHPRDAFRETHLAVRAVRAFLSQARAGDVAASRVTLNRVFENVNGTKQANGYSAKVAVSVLLKELDRMEEILAGVVDAGADEIGSVEFRTSKLGEYRAEARRRAVAAAREKADVYCGAASVTLGEVMSLEDVDPNTLRGSGEGHISSGMLDDSTSPTPGSIVVGAAVAIVYAIERDFATQVPF